MLGARAIKAAYMRSWATKNAEARKAYRKAYYAKNRATLLEKRRDYIKAWHEANPEAVREHKKRYRDQNREKLHEAHHRYIRDENGALNEQYKERNRRKQAEQALNRETMAGRPRPDVCEACSGPPDGKIGLHFDHCHTRGHFRGWLCRSCNLALGNVQDDPIRLLKLVAYLKRTKDGYAAQFALPGL